MKNFWVRQFRHPWPQAEDLMSHDLIPKSRDHRCLASRMMFLFLFLFSVSSFALSPETKLADETQEQRAMNLFLQVRCLVCNGQVIENSDTEFSFEMRKNIRAKIAEGKSDEEIKTQLVEEFGEDILTNPSNKNKLLLWILPIIFAVGLAILAAKSTIIRK